jgi:hypothetical protein
VRFFEIFVVEIFSVVCLTPHAEKRPKTRSKQGPFFCFFAACRCRQLKKSQFLSDRPADQKKKSQFLSGRSNARKKSA